VTGAGLFLFSLDDEFQKWVRENRTASSEDLARYFSHLGDGFFLAGLMTGLYAAGEFFQKNSLRKTALLSLESWLTSAAFVLVLKSALGRARPQSGASSTEFHPFSIRANHTSFPSGHATSAFAVATTLADQSQETWVDLLSYSLASLVALSRVQADKHWISDVFAGSAIGYFTAKKICRLNRDSEGRHWGMAFQLFEERSAFTISFAF
jgi:membrane-associated phospholipid phosphatase